MTIQLREVFYASMVTVIFCYGLWGLFMEVIYKFVPYGLIAMFGMSILAYLFRIPPPGEEAVEAILGKAPHFVQEGDDSFCIKSAAHRGCGLDAPENTLAAFKMCGEFDPNIAIEFDVTLTRDEVPIVFHDDSLDRMAGMDKLICESDYEELRDIDLSVRHVYGDRFPKATIPTLEQAITQLLACGQKMMIDIKDNNQKGVKTILDLYERHQELYQQALITSWHPSVIYKIRRKNPKIVGCVAWRPNIYSYDSFTFPDGKGRKKSDTWYKQLFLEILDVIHEYFLLRITYYVVGISAIILYKDCCSAADVVHLRNLGLRVMIWGANTPAEKNYFAKALKIVNITDTLTGEGTLHKS